MRWRSDGRSAGGFTLLEMLVVLVVLGLALAVIVGRMPRPGPGVTLGKAVRTVQGALRLARSEAIASDRPVAVTFDPGGGTFRIAGAAAVRLPEGAAISAPPGGGVIRVAFAPDGSGAGGPVLLSAGSRTEAIRIGWLTGRVRVGDAESAP
ncbi:MAG: GspH/FimT family protein [Acetobacteraceae bacterium]